MIVRQAFYPDSNGCKNILREVLGDDWERKLKSSDKEAKRLQAGLASHIKNDVMETGTSMYKGAAVETLVYAHSLEKHFIVDIIMERLLKGGRGNDRSCHQLQRRKRRRGTGDLKGGYFMAFKTFITCCAPRHCRGYDCCFCLYSLCRT